MKNSKAINNLAIRRFKASRTRNIVAILAIALTTILFTSLFTVGIGMVESIQNQTLRQAGGDGHIALKYLTETQYQDIKDHPLIDKISYNKIIAESVDNQALLKRHAEMYYMDETAMTLGFCQPTTGAAPVGADEVASDTATLDLLGVPHQIGAVVPVEYTIKGTSYQKDFVLSGYWSSDPTFNVGFILVSEAFTKENATLLTPTMAIDHQLSGTINAYVMCKNSTNLEEKMQRIITESGYTVGDNNQAIPRLTTDVDCNTNWAYLGSGAMTPSSLLALLLAILLIVFSGYLIIYNVFQISVQRDIRFYGLLKTIGTTGRQIKRIMHKQTLILALMALPVGLILGFLVGKAVLPLIMNISSYSAGATVSLNPAIFVGAALFSLLTIALSTQKPAKIAASVSPVEAVKYSDSNAIHRKQKKSQDGGKIYKMAFANLTRNKKRTIVTIVSLSLSLVLLNTIFTISQGFDMDKYLARFVDTDYLAGHANYFNNHFFRMPEDGLSETMIESIKAQDSFLEGGKLYKNIYQCSIQRENPHEANRFTTNFAADGLPILDLYGLEALPLGRLDIVEGELDLTKLATGRYIIEGLCSDDDGSIDPEDSHYNIGDTVTINVDGKTYDYELLAKTRVKAYSNTGRTASNFMFYLPAETYLQIVTKPLVMTFAFNVQDGRESEMENFLERYCQDIEPLMNFESKERYIAEFASLQTMTLTVGGILSGIVGLIGLLNFINSILTSIITRRQEFATLQSIGMTNTQLIKMLMFEGGYYALLTMVTSLLAGILCSVAIVGGLVSQLWFFSYHFTVLPLLLIYPLLLLAALVIPYLSYRTTQKQSIVERLREVE